MSKERYKIAKEWHNKHEKIHTKELQKFLGINPAKIPWCAAFINAIEKQMGKAGTGKLTARSFLKYGEEVESRPQLGDIVVFKRGLLPWQGHVGIYAGEGKDSILVLGGNQSNKVCFKYYPKKKLLGIRR